MNRVVAGVVLLWRLFAAITRTGWQISWRILRRPRGCTPGFAEYRFEPMGDAATTVLACLICLTPGTTAVEVDAAAGWMRLHLLDASDGAREAALEEIGLLFERAVRTLFAMEEMS
jgi:multisubunit Na+/H+ antiporter MnhE subunit